ncbi:hypothetical protein Zmor_024207 [Zophobas morio]|uniref:Uncharacterized protein n=1 Tax=Zophobas morio TaxID=2755281 RepID=A0AA38M7W8_9CUCU|nr:hypothetical protein Zmor_024207 [Zophobas morio]
MARDSIVKSRVATVRTGILLESSLKWIYVIRRISLGWVKYTVKNRRCQIVLCMYTVQSLPFLLEYLPFVVPKFDIFILLPARIGGNIEKDTCLSSDRSLIRAVGQHLPRPLLAYLSARLAAARRRAESLIKSITTYVR